MGETIDLREITEAAKQRFFFQLIGSFHRSVRAKTSLEFVYVGWISEGISYDIAVHQDDIFMMYQAVKLKQRPIYINH